MAGQGDSRGVYLRRLPSRNERGIWLSDCG